MRRPYLLLVGSICAALVLVVLFLARDGSEESMLARVLGDMPEVVRVGDDQIRGWLRTGPVRKADVEARLARTLGGRRGWDRDAAGSWTFRPEDAPPLWSHIPFLNARIPDDRPWLLVQVLDGYAKMRGDIRAEEGSWATVHVEAALDDWGLNRMSWNDPKNAPPLGWEIRR